MEQVMFDQPSALREIHHRIKNNLQMISSFLDLEAQNDSIKSTKEIIQASQNRIMNIAALHEHLYDSKDFRNTDVKTHLEKTAIHSFEVESKRNSEKTIDIKLESATFHFDQLIPVGLIANEIIRNSIQHGGRNISICSMIGKNGYEICFEDDGLGFDSQKKYLGLGLKLIKGLAKQLNAELTFETINRTKINILIPMNLNFD